MRRSARASVASAIWSSTGPPTRATCSGRCSASARTWSRRSTISPRTSAPCCGGASGSRAIRRRSSRPSASGSGSPASVSGRSKRRGSGSSGRCCRRAGSTHPICRARERGTLLPLRLITAIDRGEAMKNGFKVLDSDLHTMEPDGLWERYLEEPFKKFAPQFVRRTENATNQPIIRIGQVEIGEMSPRVQTALVGKDLQQRAFARHPHYEIAHARGYDSESHVAAMDIEGIDVAVIYGTRGRQVQMHDDLEPEVAAALARAHNNWTRDFCAYSPHRLK